MHTEVDKKLLSRDITSIIKACGAARVTRFQYGSLTICFGPQPDSVSFDEYRNTYHEPRLTTPEAAISEIQKSQKKEALVRDEMSLREEQFAQMLIEDPFNAEKLLLAGKLDEESDGSDEEA